MTHEVKLEDQETGIDEEKQRSWIQYHQKAEKSCVWIWEDPTKNPAKQLTNEKLFICFWWSKAKKGDIFATLSLHTGKDISNGASAKNIKTDTIELSMRAVKRQ